MARSSFMFTSESVSEGHPDKVADQISDAVVDLFLSKDPEARVACETLTTTNLVVLAGEIRGKGIMDTDGNWAPGVKDEIEATVRKVVRDIGYEQDGFHWEKLTFENHLHPQSAHIAQGVDASGDKDEGAGDQGIMFGYASNETEVLMPAPIHIAHRLSEQLTRVRTTAVLPGLRPDGKTQVTLGYDGDRPVAVDTVVVSAQHVEGYDLDQLASDLRRSVISPVLEESGLDLSGTQVIINPAGNFVRGGPVGDAGLTGRKIIVDTYGGMARHGGGAFSGKDPSKVDRSAAYAMRWVAKNVVAAGLADRVEVQVAYAIGRAAPVGLYVETFGTEKVAPTRIEHAIREVFDLRPLAIIEDLDLKRPIYARTAAHGHFGRSEPEFTWERTDRVADLRSAAGV